MLACAFLAAKANSLLQLSSFEEWENSTDQVHIKEASEVYRMHAFSAFASEPASGDQFRKHNMWHCISMTLLKLLDTFPMIHASWILQLLDTSYRGWCSITTIYGGTSCLQLKEIVAHFLGCGRSPMVNEEKGYRFLAQDAQSRQRFITRWRFIFPVD